MEPFLSKRVVNPVNSRIVEDEVIIQPGLGAYAAGPAMDLRDIERLVLSGAAEESRDPQPYAIAHQGEIVCE